MNAADPIVHHPFAFDIGPLNVTGFGIAVLTAFLVGQVITERELMRRGHVRESQGTGDVLFAAVVGALVGGKLYYAAVVTGDWSDLWGRGGFVFYGSFIGALIACAITIRVKKLPFVRYADVTAIAIAAGHSIGRTGCWAVGDDYGRPWDGPLAVVFPQGAPPSTAGILGSEFGVRFPPGTDPNMLVAVFPTQLLETLMLFVVFLVLWRLRDHGHAEGWLFGVYMVLAGAQRFSVEFFRAKDDQLAVGLTIAQAISVAVLLAGIAIIVWRRRVDKTKPGIYARGT